MIERETITVTTTSGAGTRTGVVNFNGQLYRLSLIVGSGQADFEVTTAGETGVAFVDTSGTAADTIVYPNVAAQNSQFTRYSIVDDLIVVTIANAVPDGDYTVVVDVLR